MQVFDASHREEVISGIHLKTFNSRTWAIAQHLHGHPFIFATLLIAGKVIQRFSVR
jgi:hypothetical protein